MPIATLYTSPSSAVRKTADDCRRLLALFDALRITYENISVEDSDMKSAIESMSSCPLLPQVFVGEAFVGTYDDVALHNEDGVLKDKLRAAGYSEDMRGGGEGTSGAPVRVVKKKVVKKVVVVKRKAATDGESEQPPPEGEDADDAVGEEDGAPPPPPDDDEEAPPPPPDEDDEEAPPAPPDDDDGPPPPPPDDDETEAPPPPPEDE
eukprot:PhM_4_TR5027/c0_g1_i1/m.105944